MTIEATTNASSPDQTENTSLVKLFNDTRKRLVETGTRNRLVHVNRANSRGNVVNVVNERSEDVYGILSSGKTMRFLAIGRDSEDVRETVRLANVGEAGFDTERFTDAQLETRMGPDALQKRLLKIAHEAQTAEEESGVNVLYLALGFLKWFESRASGLPREAPLVLLPVELIRNHRTSTYDLRLRGDEVMTNLPLQQRLKDDFGIHLPDLELDELWSPSTYFEQVESIISNNANWMVDRDAIQLGFFSFSKLLMYRDLAIEAWPDGAIATHDLTRGLLFEGFDAAPPLMGADERLDNVLVPDNMFHVVDADASQALVIEEVRRGRNLVVQGPPGTGKSQTITNIIATAVKEGKRVLFVAEKMAALSVVHQRLVKVGLRDVCLELHSRNADKKLVLAELARTLNAAAAVPDMPPPPTALTAARDKLNLLAAELHKPIGVTGETPYSVLSLQARYIGLGKTAPNLSADYLAAMTSRQAQTLLEVVTKYGDILAAEGLADSHPFNGVQNLDLQPVDLARLGTLLTAASQSLGSLKRALAGCINILGVQLPLSVATVAPVVDSLSRFVAIPGGSTAVVKQILLGSDLPRLRRALEAGQAWRSRRDVADGVFIAAAFEASPITIRGAIAAGTQSFFTRWSGAYRNASRELGGWLRTSMPKSAKDRLNLVDLLVEIESAKAKWKTDEAFCAKTLGEVWRSDQTDFAALLQIADWCERLRNAPVIPATETLISLAAQPERVNELLAALKEAEPGAKAILLEVVSLLRLDSQCCGAVDWAVPELADLIEKFDILNGALDRYPSWVTMQSLHRAIAAEGLLPIAERMRRGEISGDDAVAEIRFSRAEHLWKLARACSPVLATISQEDRHQLAASFAELERARLKENVASIVSGHLAQVPQGAMGEMKVIRGEIGKKRGHIALRKLFLTAANAMQRIKPVMLMSPISVAQYIPPGALSFDLLVIDEASQVRPEDALGAIARSKQIVVVGDQKQLPPSSFFDRLLSDDSVEESEEEEGEALLGSAAKVGAMESVLSLCEARGLSRRMLTWHYRSRDPSLIQVSNREFYEDRLILPPSPLQADPSYGLCFTRVEGVYDKGGRRDNRKEGDAIVKRVSEHARACPDISLGIVTFSSAQKNLITELLEFERRTDSVLDAFLREGHTEDVFIKNIENVQGDERDVILVSVGYGPTIAGGRLTSMSFGPVNAEGGERRLNVLFTRARIRCEVFASFHPADIDPNRTSREGARILKRFLEFAHGSALENDGPVGTPADTPFEEDVADVIRSFGYLADAQVGSGGFRIDIGVRHPDRPGSYILAVECDGATYHSALWARERDRLRQDVLEHLGWRFHRVWSTDWFYNRRAEIERLRISLSAAREISESGIRLDGANSKPSTSSLDSAVESTSPVIVPEIPLRKMPEYKRCVIPMGNCEPHEMPIATLSDVALRIVKHEGPIHADEAGRRLAVCFGKEKAGARIMSTTRSALEFAQKLDCDLLSDGTFWFMRSHVDAPPVRDRSQESGATTKAVHISMLEIKEALKIAREENAGGDDTDLVRCAARLLGFRRVGSDLQERIAAGLKG